MTFAEFAACVLATFGVATIITQYDGPYNVLLKLRDRFPGFECYACVSVWLALYFTALTFIDSFAWTYFIWAGAVIGASYLLFRMVED